MIEPSATHSSNESRDPFPKRSAAGATIAGLTAGFSALPRVYAGGDGTIRVGLVGCGSRGTGAAAQAMSAGKDVRLVAMADVFGDQLEKSRVRLKRAGGENFAVEDDHCFVGFEAYKQVIDRVDVVLLTTPPHFRPAQFQAAIEAGKHVFAEKPVAVDAPGVRCVMATSEIAERKKLSVVCGLMLRYSHGMRETMKRIHDGAIGKIVALQANYNIGGLWLRPRQEAWSDMEWQMRNWYYFTWLSGDHIVEQHVHGLDLMAWAMKDESPVFCTGTGGRQARTGPEYGHIFDHHCVCYEYAGGVRCYGYCRQQDGTDQDTSHYVFGGEGTADLTKRRTTAKDIWRYSRAFRGTTDNMYQQEHDALFASIRSGRPINNVPYTAKSTLMSIMGRMATYTGRKITWDEAWNSQEDLTPAAYRWGPMPVHPVAVPGLTPFV